MTHSIINKRKLNRVGALVASGALITLMAGSAVLTYAQAASSSSSSSSSGSSAQVQACQKIKDRLQEKFDSVKARQQSVPTRLQEILKTKADKFKTDKKDTKKFEAAVAKLEPKITIAKNSNLALFQKMDQLKTLDCTKAGNFGQLLQQARTAQKESKNNIKAIVDDLKSEIKPELDKLDNETESSSSSSSSSGTTGRLSTIQNSSGAASTVSGQPNNR